MKIINEKQNNKALAEVEELMEKKSLSSSESKRLDSLVSAIEIFENKEYPIGLPDPIDAIRFRMEQAGLKSKDLIPYIGSKSKVSEVLNGKRNLSQEMIRNLHTGLGIPLEVLMGTAEVPSDNFHQEIDWKQFPIKELIKRKWIPTLNHKTLDRDLIKKTLSSTFGSLVDSHSFNPVYLRSTWGNDSNANPYSIKSWQWMVMKKASNEKLSDNFKFAYISSDYRSDLAKLSYLENGPQLAKEYLSKIGIHLVILEHLNKTYLDGAAMMLPDGSPVIAMTLRHDRLDNFWFVLFHELAHIALHLKHDNNKQYLEDFENLGDVFEEEEANEWAAESLIPSEVWKLGNLSEASSVEDVIKFSKTIRIHPSIPAGRIRRESGNYTLFQRIIGRSKVRKFFEI
jgi:HTH-type transcriptional regulator / antitoxin HigA